MRIAIVLATLVALAASPVLSPALAQQSAAARAQALSPAANAAFLATNGKKRGVVTTTDGLQYRILHSGFGERPGPTNQVTVYYKGQLIDGETFDSTEPSLPARFTTNKLIPGWTEALQLMRVGDHWQIVIPANLAYGTRGAGDGMIPPGQVLVFDLELLKVEAPVKDPKDDEDQNGGGQ
ncbi:MAG TPA: FKBP-type peptidyl-prolyl cis-trans isomerase [Rhizomicrobium sp.]|jgi:FKBP-type peptidyl-prolyl cis-trans isomerase